MVMEEHCMKIERHFDIAIEVKEILRLLGYKNKGPDDNILESVTDEIKKCHEYLNPALAYEKINIKEKKEDRVLLENSIVFQGKYIASKLKDCQYVVVAVSTLGKKIDEIIKSSFDSGDYLRGMIVGIIGSTAIEYMNKAFWKSMIGYIKDSDIGITSRMSPGSGGWDVSEQSKIFQCVDAAPIGITLTDSNMMIPLKSTSTVYGFGKGIGITRAEHICSECSMKNCAYRMDKSVKIIVKGKSDKIIHADIGSNLLEVLRQEDVLVESACGGRGTCGKCKVIFLKGADKPTKQDKIHLSNEEIDRGVRLACCCTLYNPAEIQTMDSLGIMNVMTEGSKVDIKIEPCVNKMYLKIDAPSLKDQRSDVKRLKSALKIDELAVGRDLMARIPEVLRENDFKVTAAAYKNILLDVEGGDTSNKSYGIAVDIGTTTLACYLVNLRDGEIIDLESEVNRQKIYGADVISRINYTIQRSDGTSILRNCIVNQINEIIHRLCKNNNIDKRNIYNMTIVGNTTMIHLFLGLPSRNISLSPFISVTTEPMEFPASEVGISIGGFVSILPAVSGYVGSDITAGILSCGMYNSKKDCLLLDLGTNGEIALGNANNIVACSTAAGPAFEGASIKHGIGGIKGAISKIDLSKDKIYKTIGDGKPCGICGSGVMDMVSELIKYNLVDETGRMADKDEISSEILSSRMVQNGSMKEFVIDGEITFTQRDVREVQLAKAAVYAGIKVLMNEKAITDKDIEKVYIAGGFGNYMDIQSALNIGLLPKEFSGRVESIGNSAGTGARMYLLSRHCREDMKGIIKAAKYIELSGRKDFQEYFVDSMMFGDSKE
jgi:uncharacterized 2Fe-2S/4Fe-4S cluster protein (DUF4445 family)